MKPHTETFATVVAALALSVMTLAGARAGCAVGLGHESSGPAQRQNMRRSTQVGPAPMHPDIETARHSRDRAGVGLDTGMPYYSFASRRISL